jgi:hypothetical protein
VFSRVIIDRTIACVACVTSHVPLVGVLLGSASSIMPSFSSCSSEGGNEGRESRAALARATTIPGLNRWANLFVPIVLDSYQVAVEAARVRNVLLRDPRRANRRAAVPIRIEVERPSDPLRPCHRSRKLSRRAALLWSRSSAVRRRKSRDRSLLACLARRRVV